LNNQPTYPLLGRNLSAYGRRDA